MVCVVRVMGFLVICDGIVWRVMVFLWHGMVYAWRVMVCVWRDTVFVWRAVCDSMCVKCGV